MKPRKTKDVWVIRWNGEDVDQFDTLKEARDMAKAYRMAFNSPVSIALRREKVAPCDV